MATPPNRRSESTRELLRVVAGLVLFGTGFVMGRLLIPAEPARAELPLSSADDGFRALADDVRGLEQAVRDFESQPVLDSGPRTPIPAASPRTASGAEGAELGGLDAATVERLAERLVAVERLLAQTPAINGEAGPRIAVPYGMSTRDFLVSLKTYADEVGDSDVVRAHRLWTMQDIRSTYGPPDEVKNEEGYIEWVYLIGDPEQGDDFDFHFVNGLCVQAH